MSIYGVLGALTKFLKNKADRVDISNLTLSLHKRTAALLLACSILTTSRQFFGEPIHCQLDTSAIALKVFESYCFMSGTYTLIPETHPTLLPENSTDTNRRLHHDSIGASLGPEDSGTVHHGYYQWVCLVLVLQAAACYLPWALWKVAEGGKLAKLLAKVSDDPLTETPVEDQMSTLGDFILCHRGWFNATALKLLLCQALCFLNALSQLYAMDIFLGRRFFQLGSLIRRYDLLVSSSRVVFPRLVMCHMSLFGASGSKVAKSGLCVLPQNILNEKIYLLLWFWFISLTIISFLQLLRQALLLAASLRTCLSPGLSSKFTSPSQVRQLLTRGSYGDIVLLQLIAANCDGSQFSALVNHLVREHLLDDSYVSQHHSLGKAMHGDRKTLANESFANRNHLPINKNV